MHDKNLSLKHKNMMKNMGEYLFDEEVSHDSSTSYFFFFLSITHSTCVVELKPRPNPLPFFQDFHLHFYMYRCWKIWPLPLQKSDLHGFDIDSGSFLLYNFVVVFLWHFIIFIFGFICIFFSGCTDLSLCNDLVPPVIEWSDPYPAVFLMI